MKSALLFAWSAAVVAGTSPDPTALIAEIDTKGARPVLTRLWNDGAAFDAVTDQIETGEASWLEVARRLRAASDAGSTLLLNHAVARALPKAPERVLALVGGGFETNDICTSPYIEPGPGVAEAYQKRTVEALRKVKSRELQAVRDRCLEGVSVPLHLH